MWRGGCKGRCRRGWAVLKEEAIKWGLETVNFGWVMLKRGLRPGGGCGRVVARGGAGRGWAVLRGEGFARAWRQWR